MAAAPPSNARAAFAPILVANLLPLAGVIFFGWRAQEVLFAYWVEITTVIALYGCLALFARREPAGESPVPTIGVPLVSGRAGSIRPIERIPPLYYRNTRFAVGGVLFGLVFWFASGTVLLNALAPDGSTLEVDVSAISTAYSLEGLGVAAVLFGVQFVVTCREFFGRRRYERYSAPIVALISARIGIAWFLVTVATVVVLLVTWPLAAYVDPTTYTEVRVLAVFLPAKLWIERSIFGARRRNEPGPVLGWLMPRDPHAEPE